MSVAIVGSGKLSFLLARGLVAAGHEIWMTDEQSGNYLAQHFDKINVASVEMAAAQSEIIILATPPNQIREAAYYLDDVRDKVVLDASSHKYFRLGFYLNTLAAIKQITGAQHVAKFFNPHAFDRIFSEVESDSKTRIVGTSHKAKAIVRILSRDIGFDDCEDIGGDENLETLDNLAISYHERSIAFHASSAVLPVPVQK